MTIRSSTASAECLVRADVATTWRIATPLTPVGFYPKFGPLPAVIAVDDQTGAWDAAGQTRTLVLSDGGSVVEHLRDVHPDMYFAYELSDFQKLFGRIVRGARAEWRFSEVDGGTRIHWTYTFFALPGRRWLLAAIVGNLWAPYMRRVLPGIAAEVERRAL
jgi:hypothetical protein